MPMTSIWKKFVSELNHATTIFSNPVQLLGDVEDVWVDFIVNNHFIYHATVGYVWLDRETIVDDIE